MLIWQNVAYKYIPADFVLKIKINSKEAKFNEKFLKNV